MWGGRAYLLPLAAAFAAAVLLAGGCGGGDSAPIEPVQGATTNEGPAALNKSALIAQADAICGEANAALSALSGGTVGSDPKFQATQELQITRSELQSLQSLNPPDQDRSVLDSFLSSLQDQVDALTRKKTAVDQGDDPASAEAEASSAASSAQAAAENYGFKDCASPSGAPSTGEPTTAPTATTPTTPTTPVPTTPTPPATGGTAGVTGGGTGSGGGTGGAVGGGTGAGGGGGTGGTGGTGGGGGVSP